MRRFKVAAAAIQPHTVLSLFARLDASRRGREACAAKMSSPSGADAARVAQCRRGIRDRADRPRCTTTVSTLAVGERHRVGRDLGSRKLDPACPRARARAHFCSLERRIHPYNRSTFRRVVCAGSSPRAAADLGVVPTARGTKLRSARRRPGPRSPWPGPRIRGSIVLVVEIQSGLRTSLPRGCRGVNAS